MNKKKIIVIAAAIVVALVGIIGYTTYANSDEVKLRHELAQDIKENDQQYEKNMAGVKTKSDKNVNDVGNPLQSPSNYTWEGNWIYRGDERQILKLDSTDGIPATIEMFSSKAQAITSEYLNNPKELNVVNGIVYFINNVRDSSGDSASAICSINSDGTEYKEIQILESAYSSKFVVYKDKIFVTDMTPDTSTDSSNAYTLYQTNLDGSNKTTICQARGVTLPYCEDDKLYFERQDINQDGGENKYTNSICLYDLNTKQTSPLLSPIETFDAFGGNMWVRKDYCVYKVQNQYFSINYATKEKKSLVNAEAVLDNKIYYVNRLNDTLYCSDMDGSNETKLSEDTISGTFQIYNGTIIYSANIDGMPSEKSISIQ